MKPELAEFPPLLPVPRKIRPTRGTCRIGAETHLVVHCRDARLERHFGEWIGGLDPYHRLNRPSCCLRIIVAVEHGVARNEDGYALHIKEGEVALTGGSAAGCFYGLATLRQLASPSGEIPCGEILDWPDFKTRGLLHDVTRGKVPTLETLKLLADRLAWLKVNQLQLYIEHSYVFGFDGRICQSDEGLTADEVQALDHYCRDRYIDLVPALATFGHMGRILSMPEYKQLAEIEARKNWNEMDWTERVRGLTLDCMNPAAHRLVERMWGDVLDAFSSPVVNLCGDEPWDLGRGKNAKLADEGRVGEAYVKQLRRTHDICAARGRRTQFWGDIIRNYPNLLHQMPHESALLHWGYDDAADYAATAAFAATEREVLVCPGTSGWKRILNAMDAAERNIRTFAASGVEHGAAGLLTTDWGDHGHFNALACSWHGIALGAALGWRADHPTGGEFDQAFAHCVLGADDVAWVTALRDASRWTGGSETWRLFRMPLPMLHEEPTLPSRDALRTLAESAGNARDCLKKEAASERGDPRDWSELIVACIFLELFAERSLIARDWLEVPKHLGRDPVARRRWADRLEKALEGFAENWRSRNKLGGLADILTALEDIGDAMRAGKS